MPTPVYTTIAHADVTEDGRVWRYSVVIRYLAAWRETFDPDPDFPGETGHEDHDACGRLYLYHHPADEALRHDNYHEYVCVDMNLDHTLQPATAQDITPADWHDLFLDIDQVYGWPTFADTDLYPQMIRVINRLLQEAGVP